MQPTASRMGRDARPPRPCSLRPPAAEDAAAIWRALPEIGELERNSAYAYVLLCTHFAGTAVVAHDGAELAGFVLGYRPPTVPDAVFVWQVGVRPAWRGAGLGQRLLDEVVWRAGEVAAVRELHATVAPDNLASRALFHGFARRRGVACAVRAGFPAALFPAAHADEELLVIGPLPGGGGHA